MSDERKQEDLMIKFLGRGYDVYFDGIIHGVYDPDDVKVLFEKWLKNNSLNTKVIDE